MSSQTAAVELPGIVVALPQEARSLGARGARIGDCLRMESGWLALAGMGHDNAQAAAELLIAKGAACLLSWGIAGGLVPALRPGDLLIPDRIFHPSDGDALIPDAAVCERLIAASSSHMRVQRGALWSASETVLSAADKQTLAARAGVVAVDMESTAVATVAARANLPFVAVKAICDPAERSVPPVALSLMNSTNGLSLRGVFGAILGGPPAWRALVALRRDFADAQRTLIMAAPWALPAVLPV